MIRPGTLPDVTVASPPMLH